MTNKTRELEPTPCPLCGQPTISYEPHKECMDYEEYLAEQDALISQAQAEAEAEQKAKSEEIDV